MIFVLLSMITFQALNAELTQFAQLTSTQCAENLPYGPCGDSYDFGDTGFVCSDYNFQEYMHTSWLYELYDDGALVYTMVWLFDQEKTLYERFQDASQTGEHVLFTITTPDNIQYGREETWRYSSKWNTDITPGSSGSSFSLDDGLWIASSAREIDGDNGGAPWDYSDAFGIGNFNDNDCCGYYSCDNYYFDGVPTHSENIVVKLYFEELAGCSNPTAEHGDTHAGVVFESASINAPETCQSESRARQCSDGVWGDWFVTISSHTGSVVSTYTEPVCEVMAQCANTQSSSTVMVQNGDAMTRDRFSSWYVNAPAICLHAEETRTCNDGSWESWVSESGYNALSCTVRAQCSNPNAQHGQNMRRHRYESAVVIAPAICEFEIHTRICDDGSWSIWDSENDWTETMCEVREQCSNPTARHGDTNTQFRFESDVVYAPATCEYEIHSRVCNDGTWGSWDTDASSWSAYSCTVIPQCSNPVAQHGDLDIRTMYEHAFVNAPDTCEYETQTRVCVDGAWESWNGVFFQTSCTVREHCSNPYGQHGATNSRFRYKSTSVFIPDICQQETETRECDDGVWGSWNSVNFYPAYSCTVENPCPDGFTPVGTLSTNNDIVGPGLGQSTEATMEDCKSRCDENPDCVAFMYGGESGGDQDFCELSPTIIPDGNYWDNFRFCAREDVDILACPIGYTQIGTRSQNNDIIGSGLGQSLVPTINDCQALCEGNGECVAFMYGGDTYNHPSMDNCELASVNTPNTDWWDRLIFCSYNGLQFAQLTSDKCAEKLPYGECGSSLDYDFQNEAFMCTDEAYAEKVHSIWDQQVWDDGELVYTIQWTFDEPKTLRERFLNAAEVGEHVVYEIRVADGGTSIYEREQLWRFSDSADFRGDYPDHDTPWLNSGDGVQEGGFSFDNGVWVASSANEIDGQYAPGAFPDMFGVGNFNSRDSNENKGCGNYYYDGQAFPSPNIKVKMFMRHH